MIKVFYGENRVQAQEAIRKFLGVDYEVVEGADLAAEDLPNVFWGRTLLAAERAILVRDLLAETGVASEVVKYLDTPHKVALWELKVDKRSVAYKELKDKVEFLEFKPARDVDAGLVFDIYGVAKRDGARAVEMLEKIKDKQEPMMFLGLMVTQAVRDYTARPGAKTKKALTRLSELDMQLKGGSKISSWTLISGFLLRLAS